MKDSLFAVRLGDALPAAPRPRAHPNRPGGRVLRVAVVLSAFAAALPASAEAVVAQVAGDEAVITYGTPLDQRRAELRQALISGADLPLATHERPRMSREERDALNRELRQAMKAAYERRNAAK